MNLANSILVGLCTGIGLILAAVLMRLLFHVGICG